LWGRKNNTWVFFKLVAAKNSVGNKLSLHKKRKKKIDHKAVRQGLSRTATSAHCQRIIYTTDTSGMDEVVS
jgi:hypothetical protein